MMKNKYKFLACIVLLLSLICIFSGVSYAIFNYFGAGMTNNVIQTGRVVFSYSDANGGGNGIHIEDAEPIPDDMGKLLSGDGEYFDFSVSASTTTSNLSYEITVNKDEKSTLPDEYVKIYLTAFDGNREMETPLSVVDGNVVTYSELKNTDNKALTGKTIYYGSVQSGEVAYGQKFRLRMWIKVPEDSQFDYSTIDNKAFSLKVNVAASSVY